MKPSSRCRVAWCVQTLVWHRGAMLYYVGRYDDAIRHLENTAAQFEDK